MKKPDMKKIGRIVIDTAIGVFLAAMVAVIFRSVGYRRGQIDAINGKIRYSLVVREDNSVLWKRVPKDFLEE